MKIKICGLFRAVDIDYVNEASPDYIGFVFANSKRRITKEQAAIFKNKLNANIKVVGVFVDEDIAVVNSIVDEKIVDIVQLHGSESEEYISRVKALTIKAVRIGEKTPQNADYILFDSMIAGSGQTFDWSLLPKTDQPFFLAGGININNIEQAIKLNPYGIDVSSGVEINGYKDPNIIMEMVRRVRNV